MNKQLKTTATTVSRGIEWTDYTWNPVGGCKHRCRWRMPDGTISECYAESTANTMTTAYTEGFEHHYWRPHKLVEPERVKVPSRIFLDSMSDLMGHWVPAEQIEEVLAICRRAHWHTFQLLTKNAPRLRKFKWPLNVWVGVSAPPTFMLGKELTEGMQRNMVIKQLDVFASMPSGPSAPIRWMSIEPLSFDIASVFDAWCATTGKRLPLDWVVIGAASQKGRYHQPDPGCCQRLHEFLQARIIPIFHKGNLHWSPHLEEMPIARVVTPGQPQLL